MNIIRYPTSIELRARILTRRIAEAEHRHDPKAVDELIKQKCALNKLIRKYVLTR